MQRERLAALVVRLLSHDGPTNPRSVEAVNAEIRELLSKPPPGAVDRAAGVVRGVRVLNSRSRMGRKYPPHVTARHAHLFAAPVAVGHHFDPETGVPLPEPPDGWFGRIEYPRADEGGITADLHIDTRHPFAEEFLSACENDASRFALSAHMHVVCRPEPDADGDKVAEVIVAVHSVDVVERGSTTLGLFL